MTRPHIPVRDGLHFPRRGLAPTVTPDLGHGEFRAGWRHGFLCGLCWGAMLVGVATLILSTT